MNDNLSDVVRPVLNMPQINGDITLASPTTETTVGAAGGASALPATPLGYIIINLGGTGSVKIPYYTA
jgi:hypothetical protein